MMMYLLGLKNNNNRSIFLCFYCDIFCVHFLDIAIYIYSFDISKFKKK